MHNRVRITQFDEYIIVFCTFGLSQSLRRAYNSYLPNICNNKMEESLLRSALEQSFIVGVFLVTIIVLWRKIEKLLDQKDSLSEGLLKITYMWEERYSKESQDDRDIKEVLKEIRDFIHKVNNAK